MFLIDDCLLLREVYTDDFFCNALLQCLGVVSFFHTHDIAISFAFTKTMKINKLIMCSSSITLFIHADPVNRS